MKWFFVVSLGFLQCGCSTPTHTWEGVDRGIVWTAMIAAAESPEYRDEDPRNRWVVTQNDVVVNPDLGHIDVHRKLRRSLKLPRQHEQIDFREFFFEIKLLPTNPASATFDILNFQLIPLRSREEADRYYSQVESLLLTP